MVTDVMAPKQPTLWLRQWEHSFDMDTASQESVQLIIKRTVLQTRHFTSLVLRTLFHSCSASPRTTWDTRMTLASLPIPSVGLSLILKWPRNTAFKHSAS